MRALITGASKGIGKAIALQLAGKGYNLAICSRNTEDLANLSLEIKNINPEADVVYMAADLQHKEEVYRFADHVLSRWDRLDVLVNNAGMYISGKMFNEKDEVFEKMMQVNVYSAYYLTKKLLPLMLPFKEGTIINICSIASLFSYPDAGSYSVSKFALRGFSTVLRDELKDKGIRVTSILPGATWSHSWKGADLPYERLMEAEDIAKTVSGILQLSPSAVVEEIILRPQLGDL